jgi:hypothetical protein
VRSFSDYSIFTSSILVSGMLKETPCRPWPVGVGAGPSQVVRRPRARAPVTNKEQGPVPSAQWQLPVAQGLACLSAKARPTPNTANGQRPSPSDLALGTTAPVVQFLALRRAQSRRGAPKPQGPPSPPPPPGNPQKSGGVVAAKGLTPSLLELHIRNWGVR